MANPMFHNCSPMDKYKEEMSVEDVYELASEIGKEFEKIIDAHGSGNVEHLMSKVILILQHLEACCLKRDEITVELKTFLNRIYHLEKERSERAENRVKLDKELEQIEENWRKENNELINKIRKLQLENQRLQSSLSMYTSLQGLISISESTDAEENRINESKLNQLRIQCENQQKELASKDEHIEKLHEQIEDCQQRTREVKKKLKNLENSYIEILEENLNAEVKTAVESPSNGSPVKSTTSTSPSKTTTDKVQQSTNDQPNLPNKQESPQRLSDKQRREMVKSRFSFAELREIIMEKNRLRSRVAKLEESLSHCRCRSPLKVRSTVNSPRRMAPTGTADLPVQGPINKEPEEKLFPNWKRSSKIVKFFPSFTWANLRL